MLNGGRIASDPASDDRSEGPVARERPIQRWKKLSVFENGFQHGKHRYSFQDIDSLEFRWVATNVRVNFLRAGTDHEAHLKINLTGDRGTIWADYNGSITKWPQADAEDMAKQVYHVYAEIARRSYEHRMRKYQHDLNDYGYFIYDGVKFYLDGTVVFGNKNANINTHKLLKRNNRLQIQIPSKEGFWNRVRETLWDDPNINIEIEKDSDCFYVLIRTLYRLAFTRL